jgi:hypothetical protein
MISHHLATLLIALMAFISTATAQQTTLYASLAAGCSGTPLFVYEDAMAGTAENNCTATCLKILPPVFLSDTEMNDFVIHIQIFDNKTTCYFSILNITDTAVCVLPGVFFDSKGSDQQRCQKLNLPALFLLKPTVIVMQCYTAAC